MGVSGSGKSTLLNILGFTDKPTSGRYLIVRGSSGSDSVYEDGMFDFDEFKYSFTSTLYSTLLTMTRQWDCSLYMLIKP